MGNRVAIRKAAAYSAWSKRRPKEGLVRAITAPHEPASVHATDEGFLKQSGTTSRRSRSTAFTTASFGSGKTVGGNAAMALAPQDRFWNVSEIVSAAGSKKDLMLTQESRIGWNEA